jgi:hypothetical protein
MENYRFSKHWISKVIEAMQHVHIKSSAIASILVFGLPFDLILLAFFIVKKSSLSPIFVVPYILVATWLNFGPFFIWYYDQRLLPEFFHRVEDLIPNSRELASLALKYERLFARGSWILIIPWITLIILIVNPRDYIFNVAGINGFQDPFSWLFLGAALWLSFLAGFGSWGVVVTILAIRDISNRNLAIDPLHTDRRGGLGCFGYYAIGTTLLFSSGSVILPMAFQLIAEKTSAKSIMYIFVLIYSLLILLSFVYPIIRINIKAKLLRDKLLDQSRRKYKIIAQALMLPNKELRAKIEDYIELNKTRADYEDFRNVKLYPFELDTIAKLASSVLLPILFMIIQYYWFH